MEDSMKREATIELDLEYFSKQELINLILYAHKNDLTINQSFVKILTDEALRIENFEYTQSQIEFEFDF